MTFVYTSDKAYEPEWMAKHEWGVVMGFEYRKVSVPWHMIERVEEDIAQSGELFAGDDGEVLTE